MERFDVKFALRYKKDGVDKTQWIKIGSAFKNDKGAIGIKLDTMPVGAWDGRLSLFEPKVFDNSAQLGMSTKKPYEPSPDDF